MLEQVASPNSGSEQILWVLSGGNWTAPKSAPDSVSRLKRDGEGDQACAHPSMARVARVQFIPASQASLDRLN